MRQHPPVEKPIDLVYTWVDGTWPGHFEAMQPYVTTPKHTNPERYRDAVSMLRYSLRSVAMYLPWVENIYVVTARPQVPPWLDTDHPRIKLVHHDQFFAARHLPTFSSEVIESYLHEIAGLSEHFIYMNDDFLAWQPVDLSHFVRRGKYRVYKRLFNDDIAFAMSFDWVNTIGLRLVQHNPLFLSRTIMADLMHEHAEAVEETRMRRFRFNQNLSLWRAYREHLLAHHARDTTAIWYRELTKSTFFHRTWSDVAKNEQGFYQIRTRKPMFYCLNDDMGPVPNPEAVAHLRAFLDEAYPEPSEFER